MPIRPFLTGQTFDPETVRLLGVAFEMARAAIKCPRDLSDEIIAGRIIELAKAGERNAEVLSEAALNVPGAISTPILLRFPLHRRSSRVLHLEPMRRAAGTVGRVLALRDDTFKPHLAGMGEDGRAVALGICQELTSLGQSLLEGRPAPVSMATTTLGA